MCNSDSGQRLVSSCCTSCLSGPATSSSAARGNCRKSSAAGRPAASSRCRGISVQRHRHTEYRIRKWKCQSPPELGARRHPGALPADQRTLQHFFNTSAFVAPPAYTFGNVAPYALLGPGYVNLDLVLSKTFTFVNRSSWIFAPNPTTRSILRYSLTPRARLGRPASVRSAPLRTEGSYSSA